VAQDANAVPMSPAEAAALKAVSRNEYGLVDVLIASQAGGGAGGF